MTSPAFSSELPSDGASFADASNEITTNETLNETSHPSKPSPTNLAADLAYLLKWLKTLRLRSNDLYRLGQQATLELETAKESSDPTTLGVDFSHFDILRAIEEKREEERRTLAHSPQKAGLYRRIQKSYFAQALEQVPEGERNWEAVAKLARDLHLELAALLAKATSQEPYLSQPELVAGLQAMVTSLQNGVQLCDVMSVHGLYSQPEAAQRLSHLANALEDTSGALEHTVSRLEQIGPISPSDLYKNWPHDLLALERARAAQNEARHKKEKRALEKTNAALQKYLAEQANLGFPLCTRYDVKFFVAYYGGTDSNMRERIEIFNSMSQEQRFIKGKKGNKSKQETWFTKDPAVAEKFYNWLKTNGRMKSKNAFRQVENEAESGE